jgi:hypothetical protein
MLQHWQLATFVGFLFLVRIISDDKDKCLNLGEGFPVKKSKDNC